MHTNTVWFHNGASFSFDNLSYFKKPIGLKFFKGSRDSFSPGSMAAVSRAPSMQMSQQELMQQQMLHQQLQQQQQQQQMQRFVRTILANVIRTN